VKTSMAAVILAAATVAVAVAVVYANQTLGLFSQEQNPLHWTPVFIF